ncbi:MAG TPA: hypothetical protein VGD17_15245 [Chitinophagaceae bacterium]
MTKSFSHKFDKSLSSSTLMLLFVIVVSACSNISARNPGKTNDTQAGIPIGWTAGWSHDDKFVAAGFDNGELIVYETTTWKVVKKWNYNPAIIARVEWNPKFPILAVAAISHDEKNSIVQLYDIVKNETIITHSKEFQGRGVTWSPDGELVAFVGREGRIGIFTRAGKDVKTLSFRNPGSLFDIDWHPAKNIILAVEENIFLIDIKNDSLISTIDDGSNNKGILCCQWHPSGNFFVTGDYGHESSGGEPSYVKYWDKNGTLIKMIREADFEYRNLRWSNDGKYLAASSNYLLILNDTGRLIRKTKFDSNNLWGVGWNSKADKIISNDQVGNVRISDTTGKILHELQK